MTKPDAVVLRTSPESRETPEQLAKERLWIYSGDRVDDLRLGWVLNEIGRCSKKNQCEDRVETLVHDWTAEGNP